MASLNDSKRGKTQAPQTILSEGAVLADRFGAPPPAWSMPADPSWHDPSARPLAIAKGQVAADELRPDDIDALVKIARQLPPHYAAGIARGMIGEGPGHRKVTRAINVMQSRVSDSTDLSVLPPGADGLSLLADARMELLRRQTEGRDFRKATGMGLGLIDDHSANLIGPNGKIIATLPISTIRLLSSDPKFGPAIALLRDAGEGLQPSDLPERIAAAVAAAKQGRAIGDALIFESDDTRIEAIRSKFAKLFEPGLSRIDRDTHLQELAMTLFAEALESERAQQMLLDMVPLIGNLRAAEATINLSEAAAAAFAEGDNVRGAKLVGAALVNFGGAITGVAGAGGMARLAAKPAAKLPVIRNVVASKQVGKAIKQGDTPLESRGIKHYVAPEDWAKHSGALRNYANGLFSQVKGRVSEDQIKDRLRLVGIHAETAKPGAKTSPTTVIVPNSNQKRIYDITYQNRILKSVWGFAYSKASPGWRSGGEFKLDAAQYNRRQRSADTKITDAASDIRERALSPELEARSHNNPPGLVDDLQTPTPSASKEPDLVDVVVLLRFSSESIDARVLAESFVSAAHNPKGKGMTRAANGDWTVKELEALITDVQKGLRQAASSDFQPAVADVIAGVLIRLGAEFIDPEAEDQSARN